MTESKPLSPQEARDQAAEFFGFTASVKIEAGGKVFEIPNPSVLDDDQQERYDDLKDLINQCDKTTVKVPIVREAEVEVYSEDGKLLERRREQQLVGHEEIEQPVMPYALDGKRIRPAYSIQLAQAILGDDYQAYKAGGGRSSQINLEWTKMQQQWTKRLSEDSKSPDGSAGVEAVADGD